MRTANISRFASNRPYTVGEQERRAGGIAFSTANGVYATQFHGLDRL